MRTTVFATHIERAPFGPVTSLTRGNGLTETRSLDQAYQVDAITVPGILERDYGHTVDANVATIDDLLASARHQAFGYDAADRLASATGDYGALGFEYDPNANRTARLSDGQRHSYQVNRSNNWLLEAASQSYQHDAAGNLVQRGFRHRSQSLLQPPPSLRTQLPGLIGRRGQPKPAAPLSPLPHAE